MVRVFFHREIENKFDAKGYVGWETGRKGRVPAQCL